MAEKLIRCAVKREPGFLYFIDKSGDVSRSSMAQGAKRVKGQRKVVTTGIKKEAGYLYFLDKDGDVSRAIMARGRGKKSKK